MFRWVVYLWQNGPQDKEIYGENVDTLANAKYYLLDEVSTYPYKNNSAYVGRIFEDGVLVATLNITNEKTWFS